MGFYAVSWNEKIKDRRCLRLIGRILSGVPWKKGLPIGNLTSQFLANVYLDPLDHFVKERLQCKKYVRYMDDMVFLSNSSDSLKGIRTEIDRFLNEKLRLELKREGTYLNRRSNGIGFLGARIFPGQLRIKPSCLRVCTG